MADPGLNGDGPPSKRAKVQDPSNDFDQKSNFEGFSELPELPDELIGGGGDPGASSLGVVGPNAAGPSGAAGAGNGGGGAGTATQCVTSVVGVSGVSSITIPQAGAQMQQMAPNPMLQKQMVSHGAAAGGKTVLIQQGVQGGQPVFGVSQGDPNSSHSNNAMTRIPNATQQIRVRMGSPQHHMNMGAMNAGAAQMNQAQLQNALQNKQGLAMNPMSSQPNIVQGNAALVRLPTSDANAMGGLRPNATTMMNGPQGGHIGGIGGPGVVQMGMNRGISPMNINPRMMNGGHPGMSMNNPNCPTMSRVPVSGTLVQNQGMMVMNTTNVPGPGGQMIMQGQFRPNGPIMNYNINMQPQQMAMGPNQVLVANNNLRQTVPMQIQTHGMNMQPGQIGGPVGQQIIQGNQQVMNPAGGNILSSVPPMSVAGNQPSQSGQPGMFLAKIYRHRHEGMNERFYDILCRCVYSSLQEVMSVRPFIPL